jgi:Coenzyme PQQ synthesis protein D (PqqD)
VTARRAAGTAWPANGAADGALVPRRRAWVHGVELDSESVLYDEKSGRLHFLNWSASAVWWSIDGVASANALAADLAAQFGDGSEAAASPSALRDDVLRLLSMLGSQALIEAVT